MIAVALFAALSYAVTATSRSSASSISKEKAEILAAELMQYYTFIESSINRLKLSEGYKVIYLTKNAASNGTIFLGNDSVQGKFVGLFHPNDGGGVPPKYFPAEMYYNNQVPTGSVMTLVHKPIEINGEHLGSAAAEDYLVIPLLSAEICKALNKKIKGNENLPAHMNGTMNSLSPSSTYRYDGSFFRGGQTATQTNINIPEPHICVRSQTTAPSYIYYRVLTIR